MIETGVTMSVSGGISVPSISMSDTSRFEEPDRYLLSSFVSRSMFCFSVRSASQGEGSLG